MEKFYDQIMDLIKVLSGKTCIESVSFPFQTEKYIYYTYNDKSFLIHEFCHYLASNNSDRIKPNLGMKIFEDSDTDDTNNIKYFISELKTIYFTSILFKNHLNKMLANDDIKYMLHLCDYTNKFAIMEKIGIINFKDINFKIWRKQLDRKLSKLNTSVCEVKSSLMKSKIF